MPDDISLEKYCYDLINTLAYYLDNDLCRTGNISDDHRVLANNLFEDFFDFCYSCDSDDLFTMSSILGDLYDSGIYSQGYCDVIKNIMVYVNKKAVISVSITEDIKKPSVDYVLRLRTKNTI